VRITRISLIGRKIAAMLVVLALAVRIAVPSGWMPSADRAFALTVCTGFDTQTIWLDKQGGLHKQDPSKGKAVDHAPCAFASAVIGIAPLPDSVSILAFSGQKYVPPFGSQQLFIGHGLAAPPPPSTGPPLLI
jgi:hypothetical protein